MNIKTDMENTHLLPHSAKFAMQESIDATSQLFAKYGELAQSIQKVKAELINQTGLLPNVLRMNPRLFKVLELQHPCLITGLLVIEDESVAENDLYLYREDVV